MTNNRNLEALKDLISSARSNKFSTLRKIVQDDSDVYEIWDMVSQWIEFNMQRHKAVNVSGFGCFTFTSKELDIGYKRYIVVQRPVFILSEKLISIHRLNQPKYLVPGEIPVTQLNFIALAHELDISRDVVEASVKEIIQAFSRKIDKCGGAEFPFTTIGNLVVHNGQAKMKFLPSFLDNMDKTGGLVKYFTNRPETSDSILETTEGLPQVSLPRIEPGGDIDLARTDSRGCVADETKPESKASVRGGDQVVPTAAASDEKTGSPQVTRKKEALTATLKTGSVSAPEPQVVSKVSTPRSSMKGRCGGVVFNDPRFANLTPSQELPSKLDIVTEVVDDTEKDIEQHRLGSPQRVTKSLDSGTKSHTPHIHDMNNIGRLTPPRVKTRRLSLEHPAVTQSSNSSIPATRVKSDGHRRGTKKSCTDSCTPAKCDNCTTKNTDFCYLCFQREKRNVPVYFAEQRKQKEAEEDRLLQMYQHLRDSESLTKEQQKKEQKREESQQIAAFNLGVAEAIKAREDERPTDYHRSFVFYKRPVTPPLWVQLEEDLGKQVSEKQHKRIKEKHDRDCLERLEQMQLAEDLAAQRNHYLSSKKLQSEEYRKALDTQVYIRQCLTERDNFHHRLLSSSSIRDRGMSMPRANIVMPFQKEVPVRLNRASATRLIHYRTSQLPAAEPDSDGPIFGIHDSTMEKERHRRKCARELYESQVKMAQGKQQRMASEDLQRRTEEDKMLKKTRAELITECCARNERNIKQRKNLERSWATNAAMKHAREKHELDRTRSPGLLLLEQCESYDRCAQCCRKSKNCGESNVWSESRYVAGSRLIV